MLVLAPKTSECPAAPIVQITTISQGNKRFLKTIDRGHIGAHAVDA
jgi:hypothetical protein